MAWLLCTVLSPLSLEAQGTVIATGRSVEMGERVRIDVPDAAGQITGWVISVEGDSVSFRPDGSTVAESYPSAWFQSMEVQDGTQPRTGTGAVVGGVGGLGIGWLLSSLATAAADGLGEILCGPGNCRSNDRGPEVATLLGGAVGGALLGALIGSRMESDRWAPAHLPGNSWATPSLWVAPASGPGIRLGVSFGGR